MATTDEISDAELLQRFVRAAELLQAGHLTTARMEIEAALKRRPDSQRGQNLLALCCFKLGQFDQAEALYRKLIAKHSEDAGLRVNLGLVFLKVGRPQEAIDVLTSVLQRTPEHPKAANYIGLAHAQLRDYAAAWNWFKRAGNTAMAERMVEQQRSADPRGQPFLPTDEAPAVGWQSAPPYPAEELPLPSYEPSNPDATRLFNRTAPIAATARPAGSPFTVDTEQTVIELAGGEVILRLDGMLAMWGNVDLAPAFKNHRGRSTEKAFGEGDRRMHRASGAGRLWIGRSSGKVRSFDVAGISTFVREEVLVAFEARLAFDNGRLVSRQFGEIALVNLREQGHALLAIERGWRPVTVNRDEPCRVPSEILLGWQGDLVPKLLPLVEGGSGRTVVELAGTGTVLLDAAG